MCISVSTSSSPGAASWTARRRPFVCPRTRGAIDPSFFTGSVRRRATWSGRASRPRPTRASIWITRVSAQRHHAVVDTTRLLLTHRRSPGRRGIIENPSMIGYRGRYYLFYSGGSYADDTYATGYAVCRVAVGPCTRASGRAAARDRWAVSRARWGDGRSYDAARRLRLAYAAWDFGNTGYPTTRDLPARGRRAAPSASCTSPRSAPAPTATRGPLVVTRPWLGPSSCSSAWSRALLDLLLSAGHRRARGPSGRPGRQRPVPARAGLPRRLPGPDRVARRRALLRGLDHGRARSTCR